MSRTGSVYRWPLDLLSVKYFWDVSFINFFFFCLIQKYIWMTVWMQQEKRVSVLKEAWFSVSAVLPVFGKPSLLFPLGVGAAGPTASRQQDRIHLEGGAGLRACEWIFTLGVLTLCAVTCFLHMGACLCLFCFLKFFFVCLFWLDLKVLCTFST